jgi:hypothetical protein
MNDPYIHVPNLGKEYLENGQFVYWNFCGWNCPRGTTPVDHRYEEATGVWRSPIEVRDILIGDGWDDERQTILKWRSPEDKPVPRFAVFDNDLQRGFPNVEIKRGTIVEVAGRKYQAEERGFQRWWFQLCAEE